MENGFDVINLHGSVSGAVPIPVIGENGNWYVGNKDTGTAAEGKRGEIGPIGPQGPKGETPPLTTDLLATEPGAALDATMGKALDEKIADLAGQMPVIQTGITKTYSLAYGEYVEIEIKFDHPFVRIPVIFTQIVSRGRGSTSLSNRTEKGFKITLSNNNYDNTAALGFSLMWIAAG